MRSFQQWFHRATARPCETARGTTPSYFESLEPRTLMSVTAENAAAQSLIHLDTMRADGRFASLDGAGYSVAVIDTGADLDHSFFGADLDANGVADRIVYQHDFAENDDDASDHDGHGSNVASLIGSSDDTYPGIAPGINLIILKVFDDGGGTASGSDVRDALRWVRDNVDTYKIAAVNLSFGFGRFATEHDGGYETELAEVANLGVIPVASAGNEFFSEHSALGVAYPAADAHSIAVGAVWASISGEFDFADGAVDFTTAPNRVISFSQRHPDLVDVMAPGGLMAGAGLNNTTLVESGTSQAAAVVSGVAALAQQLAMRDLGRRLTYDEFAQLIRSTGVTIKDGDDEDDNVVNSGFNFQRIDMLGLATGIYDMAVPLGWRSVSGDLNNDGLADLIFRNYVTGENEVAFGDGQGLGTRVALPDAPDLNWTLASTADFNRDNKLDLLWRHNGDGRNAIWLMDSTSRIGVIGLATAPNLNWKVGGVGNIDRANGLDIVWRNTSTGDNAVWLLDDAGQLLSVKTINRAANLDWQIVGVNDFSADGRVDLVWRNRTTGDNAVWVMNGLQTTSVIVIPPAPNTDWEIIGTSDFDDNNTTDLLWQNTQTMDHAVWKMLGTAPVAVFVLPEA